MKLYLWLVTALLCVVAPLKASDVIQSLQHDINSAQAALNKTEKQLARENSNLSRELLNAENAVLLLRKETEGVIRAQDEAALSIEDVENRLKQWQQQSQYQTHLLTRYLSESEITPKSDDLTELLALAKKSFDETQQRQGLFYQSEVVFSDGNTHQAELIDIGPFTYFKSDNAAGLIEKSSQHNEVAVLLENAHDALTQLKDTGSALLPIDPSNGRATMSLKQQENIISHISKGGVWVAPILLFALFALLISIYKLVQLARLDKIVPAVTERLSNLNGEHSTLKLGSWQTELVEICQRTPIGQLRDDSLFNALNEQKKQLDNLLGAIAVTAAVAPLLGLLGTVSGMIETFKLMTLFGAGDPAAVSGGISEALVTTELGLVVAIPALLCHAFLSRKVKSYYHQLEQCAISLSQFNFNQNIELHKGAA
ncbi:MotA/TolQ/ExbB proton channel family protein [Pseudoalteromonas spongiae]|uniref:MotA/TolQ/ExbB proton channel family protein n=1 Tax=Pseudoalteromonas spongiae TaxID=298657 RepID=UPI00026CB7BB|nr:MotA/TolQ/ExbB proton channel family protein [Pseudoalteromonas spongiae]ATD00696.1 biopolymer transport protein ExbB [Pseudoalteromonas spongiae UST010723-006]